MNLLLKMLNFSKKKNQNPEHAQIEEIIRSVDVSTSIDFQLQINALRKIALDDLSHTSNARLALGLIYLFGYGVEEDPDESKYWCHKADEKENILARKLLKGAKPVSPHGDPISAVAERAHSFGFKWVQSGSVNEKCDFITAFPDEDFERILALLLEGDKNDWHAFLLLFENFLKSKGMVGLLEKVEAGHDVYCKFSQYVIEKMNPNAIPYWFGWPAIDTEVNVLKQFDDLYIDLLSSGNTPSRNIGRLLANIFHSEYSYLGAPEDLTPNAWQEFIRNLRHPGK